MIKPRFRMDKNRVPILKGSEIDEWGESCVFDAKTGLLEQAHKGCKTRTILHPGGTFTIEREGIVTVIMRTDTSAVKVTSRRMTA